MLFLGAFLFIAGLFSLGLYEAIKIGFSNIITLFLIFFLGIERYAENDIKEAFNRNRTGSDYLFYIITLFIALVGVLMMSLPLMI